MINQSGLMRSDIFTLDAVPANAASPPQHLAAAAMLPCEPRFLLRLPDDEQGRSRWISPEAYQRVSSSRFLPPLHESSRRPQEALAALAAHENAVSQTQHRQKFLTNHVQERAALEAANAAEATEEGFDSSAEAVNGGEEEAREENAPQQGEQDGAGAEQSAPKAPQAGEGAVN